MNAHVHSSLFLRQTGKRCNPLVRLKGPVSQDSGLAQVTNRKGKGKGKGYTAISASEGS